MSLLLPNRHGFQALKNDSRLTLDSTGLNYLTDDYGFLIIGCGNPLLTQDFHSEWDGGNNAKLRLWGHRLVNTTSGYGGIEFKAYGNSTNAEQFHIQFRPTGSTITVNAYSATVTLANCVYIAIERLVDDYAIHLFDREGNITSGSFVTHEAGSAGIVFRTTVDHEICLGGEGYVDTATQTEAPWRNSLENLVLVQSSSPIADKYTKIQNLILGGNAVTEFGVGNVLLYRTLKDLTASSLEAHADAINDTWPALTLADHNIKLGSPLGSVDTTVSVSLMEERCNFYGLIGEATTGTIELTGTSVGTTGGVEGRLLDDSLTEIQTWQTLDAVTSGDWEGAFTSVPRGVYHIELRPINTPANVFEGRFLHIVAPVFLIIGQSQDQIAFDAKSTSITLPSVSTGAKAFVVNVNRNSSYGYRPSVLSVLDSTDYSDGLLGAQIEWEREHPGEPVVWVRSCIEGSGVNNWLNNDTYQTIGTAYKYVGDLVTLNTGLLTDIKLTIKTDFVNGIVSWGTNDKGLADYSNHLDGLLHNSGTGFTGGSYSHYTDLYDDMAVALTPLSRAIGVSSNNYTADPVDDDYVNSTSFREEQETLFEGWASTKPEKHIVGPSVNDMLLTNGGGPHQPAEGEEDDDAHYLGGSVRLGSRWGQAAAFLHSSSVITLPSLGDAMFTDAGETAFSVTVDRGSFGALKNNDGTNDVSGIEISEDNGSTWNRKGFTASYSGQVVTVTKSAGDWTSATLLWRYHKGGPYSYGTSYVTEMRADVNKSLYATGDQEGGLGIPVTQKTNGENGGIAVADFVASGDTVLAIDEFEVTVDGTIGQKLFVTGDVCGYSGSDITINSITPAWDGTMNGAMVNPDAGVAVDQGFDVRLWSGNYSASVNVADDLPITLTPPFSLVVTKSFSALQSGNDPQIDTAAVFTFLTSEPVDGSFRPPYQNGNQTFIRNISEIDDSILQAEDRTAYTSVPDLAATTEQFRRPQIEIRTNYEGRAHHPATNQNTYGREIAKATADAVLSLNLDYTTGEKQALLYYIIQYGIDLHGMVVAGGNLIADGGHNMGRLGVIVMAARLLDNAAMLASAQSGNFQETQQVQLVDSSDVALARSASDDRQRYQFTSKMIGHLNWGAKHGHQPEMDKSNFYPEEFLSGDWTGQTGSAYVPYGVDHVGKRWRLDVDTAAIETIEPGVTGWTEIGTSDADYRVLSGSPTLAHILAATMMGIDGDWDDANVINYYKNKFWQMEGPKAGADTNSITDFVASMYSDLMPSLPAPVLSAPSGIDSEGWCKCTTDSSGGDFALFAVISGGTAPDATTWETGAGAALFIQIEPSYQYEYLFNAKSLDNISNNHDVYYRHKNIDGTSNVVSVLHSPPNVKPIAVAQSITVDEDSADNIITLLGNDSDGSIASYSAGAASAGTLTGAGSTRLFTPPAAFTGVITFDYTVTDDDGAESDPVTFVITVVAVGEGEPTIAQPVTARTILRDSILQII